MKGTIRVPLRDLLYYIGSTMAQAQGSFWGFYEGFGLLPRVTRRLWYSRTQMKDGAGAVSRLQVPARGPCLLFSPESSLGVLGLWVLDSGFFLDFGFKI